ncbi:MAG: hypothetical protein QM784_22190 [Polyangiaceae bacterium]
MLLRACFRWFLALIATPFAVIAWPKMARAGEGEVIFGGMHLGYGIGASAAQTNGGLRHGVDAAFVPILFVTEYGGSHSFTSKTGLALGPSALIGFGDTPKYVALDAGVAGTSLLGGFAGGGPVYRFKSDRMGEGYGFEGRVAFDFLLIDGGIRLMTLFGNDSREFAATFFLGAGRM